MKIKPKWNPKRGRWIVRAQVKGDNGLVNKFHETFEHKNDAIQYADELQQSKSKIRHGELIYAERIDNAIDSWKIHCQEHSPRTQDLYATAIKEFRDSLPEGIATIKQITAKHILDWKENHLKAGKIKRRTINSRLTPIKAFCRFLAGKYKIENPAKEVKQLKEDDPETRFLTDEEYAKIMAVDNPLFIDRMRFIANTGVRASEFCNLKWENISADQKSMTVLGKGNKKRIVPLNDIAREIIFKQPRKTAYIYLSKNNRKMHRWALFSQCSNVASLLKIDSFGPHAFRHWFATQLLIKGVPIALVSELLGHSSIALTKRTYIHILPNHLENLTSVLVPAL